MLTGRLPSELRQMPATDFDLLALYWKQEPWGPWRDNLHAALIAREVRRPYLKDQRKNLLADFLVRDPEERVQEGKRKVAGLFTLFKTVATRVKASAVKSSQRTKKPRRMKVT
jgi:hypothetical protein